MVTTRSRATGSKKTQSSQSPQSLQTKAKTKSSAAKASPDNSRTTTSNHNKDRIVRTKLYYLISRTKETSTICPSQVARMIHQDDRHAFPDWREQMDPVRSIVWDEVKKGHVQVTQGGEVRPYEERNDLKGPIRVRRGPKWSQVDPVNQKSGDGE